jgi:hypothetical protein
MHDYIWDFVLTGAMAMLSFFVRGKFAEMDRLTILLNQTREEVARDHVTRPEMNAIVDKLGERFDRSFERLEVKLDSLNKRV